MATVLELDRGIKGRVIRPGDTDYDVARRVFNRMIDRRPALIVRVSGEEDVLRTLDLAHRHGLPVSIRGGGHNVAGNALVDGGVVIDHSERRAVRVDPGTRTADVEPGATWLDFDRATQALELASTGGLVSDTGVAGFTLGGGIGWLVRRQGLACDNLVEADVLTADGRVLRASADEDSDLLWALRGGGGNFGVVTRFRFRLQPLAAVIGGVLAWPLSRGRDLLRFWREFIDSASPDLCTLVVIGRATDGETTVAMIGVCHAGRPEVAERELAPLRAFGPPIMDQVGVMPYTDLQVMFDRARQARGAGDFSTRAYWKADFADELTDAAIESFLEASEEMDSPLSQIHLHQLGGAMRVEPAGGGAYPTRGAAMVYNLVAEWREASEDAHHTAWARKWFEALKPHSHGGAYINFLGDDGEARVRAAYGSNYERLSQLKRRYDPENVFRLNQNIAPAQAAN